MSTHEGAADHAPGERHDDRADRGPGGRDTAAGEEPGPAAARPGKAPGPEAGPDREETEVSSGPVTQSPKTGPGSAPATEDRAEDAASAPVSASESTPDAAAGRPAGATAEVDREHPSGATVAAPSRRFPRFTRGVARPEGGGRAASGDAPAPARQWPMLAVLGTAGLGLLITAFDAFRVGTILVGLALVGGAVLRWALPSVGMLAVRSRFTDMVTYGVLGTTIVLLAMMAQPDPWLEIPFLGDTLHFTIK